jgi:hypothetical protein
MQGTPKATQWATSAQVLSIISQAIEIFATDPAFTESFRSFHSCW